MNELQSKYQPLFSGVKRIRSRQRELRKLKGENFNIFSILGMETKENATHSAFLGELLNPKGSHLLGNVFLKRFIETVGFQDLNEKSFDLDTAQLKLEKHVGVKNDKARTGGRIDLYLFDRKGNSISIENKIYAGDQYAQIERYVNHNTSKNTVFYLTLFGTDASDESAGKLKKEKDYYCISYATTIVEWLNKCIKEAAEQAILRESIKQYSLLIKKLTNQLTDKKMEDEMLDLIGSNYLEAKLISDSLGKTELRAAHLFLDDIRDTVEEKLKESSNDWTVTVDEDLNQAWTGLRIKNINWNGISVKLEGASKVPWNDSIYGIVAPKDQWDRSIILNKCSEVELLKDGFSASFHWPFYKSILYFSSNREKSRLYKPIERKTLVEEVSAKLIELALACEKELCDIEKIKAASK